MSMVRISLLMMDGSYKETAKLNQLTKSFFEEIGPYKLQLNLIISTLYEKKYLLKKKVLVGYLSESMAEQPKRGFGASMLEWFGRDLRHIFEKYFQHHKLKQFNLLNTKYIEKQHKKLLNNKQINTKPL